MAPKQTTASDNGVYQFPYMVKPPQLTKWEAFKLSLWNPNTKELLGRTGSSWGKIILFYLVFYIVLAALFAICMTALYATLDKERPTYSNDNGLIGDNPGLGFRPLADVSDGALIKYNSSDLKSQQKYINLLHEFFKPYNGSEPGKASNIAPDCNYTHKPANGNACPVAINGFTDCNPPSYGYSQSKSPCVFLKLNKIYDWVPEYYNDSAHLHQDMPDSLIKHIQVAQNNSESNQVWISCKGEYPSDKEHIVDFNYFPTQGFPGYYYPYQHKKHEYLSPIVAVQVMNPQAYKQVNIECRAWAKNIKFMGGPAELRRGSVRFQILRDE